MVRVLCIGNRFAYPDDFGIVIYEELLKLSLEGVEIVEGGVGGMSLAPYFEDDAKILIIDYGSKTMPKIINHKDIATLDIDEYNHATSFLYLLKTLKKKYTIYLCTTEYKQEELQDYVEEIVALIKEL